MDILRLTLKLYSMPLFETIIYVKWLRGGFSDSPLKNRVWGDVREASTILIHASSPFEGKVYRLFLI